MEKACRFCNSENIDFLFRKSQLVFFRCIFCKLVFMGDTLNQKQIKDLYRYYSSTPQPFNPVTEKRYLSLLHKFKPFKKKSELLDVGCGSGHFISVAQDKGWNVMGTDISKEAVQICKEKNLNAYCGDISEIDFNLNSFDVITMFEVIEHLSDPFIILKRIYELLRPGGLLYITTPNFNSLSRFILGPKWRIFHVEHIYYFTAAFIVKLLKQNCFSKICIESGNLSIIEIKSKFFNNGDKDVRNNEQVFRNRIEHSTYLNLSKHLCNILLNLTKLGDTLYIYAEK